MLLSHFVAQILFFFLVLLFAWALVPAFKPGLINNVTIWQHTKNLRKWLRILNISRGMLLWPIAQQPIYICKIADQSMDRASDDGVKFKFKLVTMEFEMGFTSLLNIWCWSCTRFGWLVGCSVIDLINIEMQIIINGSHNEWMREGNEFSGISIFWQKYATGPVVLKMPLVLKTEENVRAIRWLKKTSMSFEHWRNYSWILCIEAPESFDYRKHGCVWKHGWVLMMEKTLVFTKKKTTESSSAIDRKKDKSSVD